MTLQDRIRTMSVVKPLVWGKDGEHNFQSGPYRIESLGAGIYRLWRGYLISGRSDLVVGRYASPELAKAAAEFDNNHRISTALRDDLVDLLAEAAGTLAELRSFAASVWYDDAKAVEEEMAVMSHARNVLDRITKAVSDKP